MSNVALNTLNSQDKGSPVRVLACIAVMLGKLLI